MEKLENIKLELGDKITFKSGRVDFVESYYIDRNNTLEDMYNNNQLNEIVKIERYVKHIGDYFDEKGNYLGWVFYTLETIYEKKEILDEPKEIEKIDNIYEITNYRGIPESALDWNFGIIKGKLNEIIDYINKEK